VYALRPVFSRSSPTCWVPPRSPQSVAQYSSRLLRVVRRFANVYHFAQQTLRSQRAAIKIDEILAEMPNLSPEELEAIGAKSHELDIKARKQRMAQSDSEPWPPPRDPKWDEFMARTESQPDDHLPDDLAHNHDRYWKRRL